MNFTREIKRELMRGLPEERCQRLALFCAALETGGDLHCGDDACFSFTCENEDIAEYLLSLAGKLFGIDMTLTGAARDPKYGRDKLSFSYNGEGASRFAEELAQCAVSISQEGEMCAYLKGAFLGGGSCTLPRSGTKTGYHLEVVFGTRERATAFHWMLGSLQLNFTIIKKGERFVVYSKSRKVISNCLKRLGALSALRTLVQISASRDANNDRNRVENCTMSNVDRSMTASAEQVRILRELSRSAVWLELPSTLRRTAQARLDHPILSYSELSSLLNISKSCLQHRIKKLISIYWGGRS